MIFIRAPYIERADENVEILAKVDGNIVAVKCRNQIGLSFHPELSENSNIHEWFLSQCEK
jgi:5'-phosphate synthase pdxT subunit